MPTPPPAQSTWRALVFGGLLPLIAYTVVEEVYGIVWGLVAGMVLGIGEIVFEKVRQGKVERITWIGNGLIVGMGAISLFTQEGVWFKLQPAILELFFAVLLVGSAIAGKPFLWMMAEKQGLPQRVPPEAAAPLKAAFRGLTFRLGIFFAAQAGLATWAALYWSTRAWAFLKGFGVTICLFSYLAVEMIWLRRRLKR